MSDLASNLDLLDPYAVDKELLANALFNAMSHAALYAYREETSGGLTWGYYGGRISGTLVGNGTVALSNNAANYVVVDLSSGAVSASTSTTNWSSAGYGRAYKVTTASGAVTAVEDHRFGGMGVFTQVAVGGGSVSNDKLADMPTANFKARASSGDGPPEDLTVEEAAALLGTSIKSIESFPLACSDEISALTAGTAKITWRIPYAFTVTAVRASLTTTQSSGSILTVDINESGSSILSTKLTIDNGEKTSTSAATPAVISDASLADDAEITVDIDQVGDGTAKGLKVYLIGHRT